MQVAGNLFSTLKTVHVTTDAAVNASRIMKEVFTQSRYILNSQSVVLATSLPTLDDVELVTNTIEIHRWKPRFVGWRGVPGSALLRKFSWVLECKQAILRERPSLIVAHSVGTLLSAKLASAQAKVPLIYDCHELETMATNESRVLKVIFSVIERLLIRKVNAVIVVNDSIAEWYENEYGFRPYVLKAYPDARWQSVDSDKTKFRSKFGIPEDDIIFLYQGLLSKGRRVEQLIDVFEQAASDRHLVFMGYGELEPLVREAASRCSRIHFHEAVPPDQLLQYTTSADVGISGVENVSLSNYYALPNKIMEYIHAGIAVLSPDFPEMRKVVLENKCGWVHEESTDSIRTQVNNLTKAEIAEKAANSVVARSSLTWESQEHVLIEVIEKVLKTSVR